MGFSFRSIRFKLLRAFGLLFLVTMLSSAGAMYFLNASEEVSVLMSDLDRVEQYTLNLLTKDKDFFAKEAINETFYTSDGQSPLRDEHRGIVGEVFLELEILKVRLEDQDPVLHEAVSQLQNEVVKYDSLYNTIIGNMLKRGFMEVGVEGEMRAAAHLLEEAFDGTTFEKDLLTLRRYEKDFMLRHQQQYATNFEALITDMEGRLQRRSGFRDAMAPLVAYRDAFRELASLQTQLGLLDQSGLKGQLNEETSMIEDRIFGLSMDASALQARQLATIRSNLWLSIALCLVISLVFSIWESRRIAGPINSLKRGVEEVMESGFRTKLEINQNSKIDEVKALVGSFTELVGQIQEQLQIIENSNEELTAQNEQLKAIASELEESNGVKDKFFSIIAHDLKGPIATLSSFLNLLIKYQDGLSKEETANMAQDISRSLNNLSELLENLLEWSRSQMGTLEFNPVAVDIYGLLERNKELYRIRAREKGITLKLESEMGVSAKADYNMVDFVVRNLLGNAIKFTMAGGQIWLRAEQIDGIVQVSVEDNGVGITPEDQDKLFKADQYLTTRGTKNEKGTGLGLLLCQEFIGRHGGKIWLESTPSKGTTFFFTLEPSLQLA